MTIAERYHRIRAELPPTVTVVLAAKTRTPDEIRETIAAGATDIGFNYVQEASAMHAALAEQARVVRWHMIGHLQSNKVRKALALFDMLQCVDSIELAAVIDRKVQGAGRTVCDVLLEINSGREPSKSGLPPEIDAIEAVARSVAALPRVRLRGLMTMGPADTEGPRLRPYFRATRRLFEELRTRRPELPLDTLSMGMSGSYREAVEEGATMVRIGTAVFGERLHG